MVAIGYCCDDSRRGAHCECHPCGKCSRSMSVELRAVLGTVGSIEWSKTVQIPQWLYKIAGKRRGL